MEWKPIETAPKDGTNVLLFQRVNGIDLFAIATWVVEKYEHKVLKTKSEKREVWEWEEEDRSHWDHQTFDLYEPTHWMPLSAPPETPSMNRPYVTHSYET